MPKKRMTSFQKRIQKFSKHRRFRQRAGIGKGMGKRFFKLRAVQLMSTTVGGDFATVFTNNPSGCSDWASVQALFDDYRVCALKIQWVPQLPNDTSAQTGYKPFYIVGDANDVTALTGITDAIQYENCKVKNLYRPWTYYFKFPKATAGSTLMNGYRDTSVISGTQSVKTYSTGLDTSQDYGQFILSFYITVKNRK